MTASVMAQPNPWLEHLQPLQLPEPISNWPLASGGWLVLGFIGLGLLWQAGRLWRQWLANGYRRAAGQRLDELQQLLGQSGAASQPSARLLALRELPQLLRRTALASTGQPADPAVIRLQGPAWWAWLDQSMGQAYQQQPFQRQLGPLLDQLAWAPDAQLLLLSGPQLDPLIHGLRQWTRRHISQVPLPMEEPPCCN